MNLPMTDMNNYVIIPNDQVFGNTAPLVRKLHDMVHAARIVLDDLEDTQPNLEERDEGWAYEIGERIDILCDDIGNALTKRIEKTLRVKL